MKDPIVVIIEAPVRQGAPTPDIPAWATVENEAETDAILAVTPEERRAAWAMRMRRHPAAFQAVRESIATIPRKSEQLPTDAAPARPGVVTELHASPERVAEWQEEQKKESEEALAAFAAYQATKGKP